MKESLKTDHLKKANEMMKDILENYKRSPEQVLEYFEFASRFNNLSERNIMLVKRQNNFAEFVQSFAAWKREGYSVNKGQKGLKILAPAKATYLNINGKEVALKNATPEQKALWKAGKIQAKERMHFAVGTVFDVSQTNYPKEKYPDLLGVGYSSEQHHNICEAICDFSREILKCPVTDEDFNSITLHGAYFPKEHRIAINHQLEDTVRLSTTVHEVAHAILINGDMSEHYKKQTDLKEIEADAMSIMIHSYLGMPIEKETQDHFKASCVSMFFSEETDYEIIKDLIAPVIKSYKKMLPQLEIYLEPFLKKEKENGELQITEKEREFAPAL